VIPRHLVVLQSCGVRGPAGLGIDLLVGLEHRGCHQWWWHIVDRLQVTPDVFMQLLDVLTLLHEFGQGGFTEFLVHALDSKGGVGKDHLDMHEEEAERLSTREAVPC
jgi:hypothetical protein